MNVYGYSWYVCTPLKCVSKIHLSKLLHMFELAGTNIQIVWIFIPFFSVQSHTTVQMFVVAVVSCFSTIG